MMAGIAAAHEGRERAEQVQAVVAEDRDRLAGEVRDLQRQLNGARSLLCRREVRAASLERHVSEDPPAPPASRATSSEPPAPRCTPPLPCPAARGGSQARDIGYACSDRLMHSLQGELVLQSLSTARGRSSSAQHAAPDMSPSVWSRGAGSAPATWRSLTPPAGTPGPEDTMVQAPRMQSTPRSNTN